MNRHAKSSTRNPRFLDYDYDKDPGNDNFIFNECKQTIIDSLPSGGYLAYDGTQGNYSHSSVYSKSEVDSAFDTIVRSVEEHEEKKRIQRETRRAVKFTRGSWALFLRFKRCTVQRLAPAQDPFTRSRYFIAMARAYFLAKFYGFRPFRDDIVQALMETLGRDNRMSLQVMEEILSTRFMYANCPLAKLVVDEMIVQAAHKTRQWTEFSYLLDDDIAFPLAMQSLGDYFTDPAAFPPHRYGEDHEAVATYLADPDSDTESDRRSNSDGEDDDDPDKDQGYDGDKKDDNPNFGQLQPYHPPPPPSQMVPSQTAAYRQSQYQAQLNVPVSTRPVDRRPYESQSGVRGDGSSRLW